MYNMKYDSDKIMDGLRYIMEQGGFLHTKEEA